MKTTHQFFIGSLIIGCLLFGVNFVQAADTETGIFKYPSLVAPIPAFPVFDATQYAQDTAKEVNEFSWSSITSALKKAATRTYSSLLRRYLNQIAQETAVYVANGTKGQKPSFYNWKWSEWSEDLLE
ncbi:hypothetical protein EOM71_02580, partial [Candidatus Falkowbacteria bacterium]|nr:hypothetical protein [Candidatus Falkowbacteria bacterium]